MQKNFLTFFFGALKVNDENSRIRIQIRTKMSWIRNLVPSVMLYFLIQILETQLKLQMKALCTFY